MINSFLLILMLNASLVDQEGSFFSYIYNVWQSGWNFIAEPKDHVENIASEFLGDFRLFLLGVYPEKDQLITYGKGEVSKSLRVTAINGVLNRKEDWLAFIKSISDSHGHVNVHSTFWPSGGWTKDMLKTVKIKMGGVTDTGRSLAVLWRRLIQEMGGIDGPGMILHYAHSIGSAETFVAKSLLTPEECQKITVITFGTPEIFVDDDFNQVIHYISYRDGISMLDPINYANALHNGMDHVIFIGDSSEGPPLIDHFVASGSYYDQIQELGALFVKQHGSVK